MYPSEKDKQYFFELLSKYNKGTASAVETEFVERLLAIMEYRRGDALAGFDAQKEVIEHDIQTRLFDSIRAATPVQAPVVHRVHFMRRYGRWAAAAVFLLLLSSGAYYLMSQHVRPQPLANSTVPVIDVKPGRSGALLTLADGRQVSLDSMDNGVVAQQGNAEIKLNNGQLVYSKMSGQASAAAVAMTYNTMSTPKGRQFRLKLPDGTLVWLNAASSLKYPTAFAGKERKVEITGEAYFEVTKNARIPFKVKINDHTEVEVLGTHFNVNAYSDESTINTTLLEGSVKVTSNKQLQMLAPGQQAQASNASGMVKLVKDANTDEAVAWKNGSFSFIKADLHTVMRQLARWYNIEVEYKGDIAAGEFSGEIDRSLTLDQVLKGLTTTRIHYSIEKNNKLLILP